MYLYVTKSAISSKYTRIDDLVFATPRDFQHYDNFVSKSTSSTLHFLLGHVHKVGQEELCNQHNNVASVTKRAPRDINFIEA